MKKLFFAAALAIVAVGGALSANAITFYEEGSNSPIICEDLTPVTCADGLSSTATYYLESEQEGQVTEIAFEDFEDLTRTN